MKKRIFILLSLFWLFYIKSTYAILVETPIDMSMVFDFCFWTICNVPEWTTWFEVVLAWIIKFVTFIASLAWVLFIVINGILYSMSWIDESLKNDSKKRIIKTLLWLIVLLLSWVILHILAPWVYN